MFVQRKIEAALHGGSNEEQEKYRDFLAFEGWRSLSSAVNEQFTPDHPFTNLCPDLKNIDPVNGRFFYLLQRGGSGGNYHWNYHYKGEAVGEL